jgi:hypothetical protein
VKLYVISSIGTEGTTETVIESDNRGVKGGKVPEHVLAYARTVAATVNAQRVEVGTYVPPLLTGKGVGRVGQVTWLHTETL